MSDHGTRSKYNSGCRCDDCRAANRLYSEQRRRAQGMLPLRVRYPESPHGTTNRYHKHHCRCGDCRRAATDAKRGHRRRNIERGCCGSCAAPIGQPHKPYCGSNRSGTAVYTGRRRSTA